MRIYSNCRGMEFFKRILKILFLELGSYAAKLANVFRLSQSIDEEICQIVLWDYSTWWLLAMLDLETYTFPTCKTKRNVELFSFLFSKFPCNGMRRKIQRGKSNAGVWKILRCSISISGSVIRHDCLKVINVEIKFEIHHLKDSELLLLRSWHF